MDIEQILTRGLGNTTYVIGSGDEAVVVDPPRDAWRVDEVLMTRGWSLRHVVETHVHNDYLSGALELEAAHGATIVAPARGGYDFRHRGVDDGDEVAIGDIVLRARATPGHTPEHLAWDIVTADGDLTAVLTGGSLMPGSAGRTDLLGPERVDELTRAQFRTLRALAALPGPTGVLPTHGAGSFCGTGSTDRARTTTIDHEIAGNPLLAMPDEDAFVATMLAGFAPYPTYYGSMAPINRAGPAVLGRRPTAPALDPAAFRTATASGVRVVDGRSRDAFAAAHLPGSVSIELGESFASYVGWHVPFGTPIALVLPEPGAEAAAEAIASLWRIGYDGVVGVLDGGVERWAAEGGEVRSYPIASAREISADHADDVLLDVRDPGEVASGGLREGAIAIPHWQLASRLDEVPRDRRVTVICQSGLRASIAASLLDAVGLDVRLMARGGVPEVVAALARAS